MSERFLANENFPATLVQWLRDQGHDVLFAGENLVGEKDPMILATALAEDRILLTFDQDFGDLVHRQQLPPAFFSINTTASLLFYRGESWAFSTNTIALHRILKIQK